MLEGVIPNHKEIMALGGPQVAVHDNQPSSIVLQHIVAMAAENPQEVGN